MSTYRRYKTIQKRGGGGRFQRWDLDKDFGARLCPWCSGFAMRPPIPASQFVDPADFNRRVCACGWDSARGSVDRRTLDVAVRRYLGSEVEFNQSALVADPDALAILEYQMERDFRQVIEMRWLADGEPQ